MVVAGPKTSHRGSRRVWPASALSLPGGGPTDVLQGSEHDRRSSPLWLRVNQLADGSCVGVATLFKSAFLAQNEKLQFARARRNTEPPADYDLIRDFITWNDANFKPLEVSLS